MSGDPPKILSDLNIRIADMPAGWFWSATMSGATEDDFAARERGEMTPERRAELFRLGAEARQKLLRMEVPGANEWMPPWRIN